MAIDCSKPDLDLFAILEDLDGIAIGGGYDLALEGMEKRWNEDNN